MAVSVLMGFIAYMINSEQPQKIWKFLSNSKPSLTIDLAQNQSEQPSKDKI